MATNSDLILLALKVISEDCYLKHNDKTSPFLSSTSTSSVIEYITDQLQGLHFFVSPIEFTDALIIHLSLHTRNRHQLQILSECLQHPLPESSPRDDTQSLGTTALQMLLEWRQHAIHNISCQTLVQSLLKGGYPSTICELIIQYFISEYRNQVSAAPQSPLEPTENIAKCTTWKRTGPKEIRFKFAHTCIQIFEKIQTMENLIWKIAKYLHIDDTRLHVIMDYILQRSSWMNYSFLKDLFCTLNLPEINEVMLKYIDKINQYLNDLNIVQFSLTSTLSKLFLSNCYLFRLELPNKCISTASHLLSIKSSLASKFNIPETNIFINSVRHGSLIIDLAIEKQIWDKYPSDSLAHSSVIPQEQEGVYFIILDEHDVHVLSKCFLSTNTSKNTILLQEQSDKSDFSYSLAISESGLFDSQNSELVNSPISPRYESLSFEEDEHLNIIKDLDVKSISQEMNPKLRINMKEFQRIICKQAVPVTFCLIEAVGLPHSGKTTALEKIFKMKVKLKCSDSDTTATHKQYIDRKKAEGFSVYDLCVLGGPPHHKYPWSYSTRGYGVIYSIICGLVRHAYLAGTSIKDAEIILPDETGKELHEQHFIWMMKKAKECLAGVVDDNDKQRLLLNGLSLVNIMNVGVNKALYQFLPILSLFCQNSLRLNIFSLERDGSDLDSKPYVPSSVIRKDDAVHMRHRSRLSYLLRFAAMGHQNNTQDDDQRTITIATRSGNNESANSTVTFDEVRAQVVTQAKLAKVEKHLKILREVDINDDTELNKCTVEVQGRITQIMQQYQKILPLRWVFLRSFINSKEVKPVILLKSEIVKSAAEIGMDENEVDDFLTTFTDYGSILYMREFGNDLVIVDIWEFLKFLDKLYYPPEPDQSTDSNADTHHLRKYGIITKSSILKLLLCEKERPLQDFLHNQIDRFLEVLMGFALAARISNGMSILGIDTKFFPTDQYYYIPRARVKEYNPSIHENDYAFIEINEINFVADVQTTICHEIMKKDNVYMIANEYFDLSQFEFRFEHEPPVKIDVIYRGNITRLRIRSSEDIIQSVAATRACCEVLIACCNAFQRKINLMYGCDYKIAISCSRSEEDTHVLYDREDASREPSLCEMCQEDIPDNMFRHCWMNAAIKCYKKLRKERDVPVTIEDLSIVAQKVSNNSKDQALAKALKINESEVAKLKDEGHEGVFLTMAILMKWKSKVKEKATKSNLIDELKHCGLWQIAELINV